LRIELSRGEIAMPNAEQNKKILDLATDVRKFEIGLFWQRSLFFWGFIAAAFVGYATLTKDGSKDNESALIIACFGFICSVAWSLANRGSKHWQEYWELEVEKIEFKVLGYTLFGKSAERPSRRIWLKSRRYSVSKLAMALSDFTIFVWLFLMTRMVQWSPFNVCENPKILIPIGTICFAVVMLFACRSDHRPKEK
jgi:hypothetical protein